MQKSEEIEKFRAYKTQCLEAFFLWNPNGRLGSDGGWQGSLYPPLRMADLVLGQKFSVAKTKCRVIPIVINSCASHV